MQFFFSFLYTYLNHNSFTIFFPFSPIFLCNSLLHDSSLNAGFFQGLEGNIQFRIIFHILRFDLGFFYRKKCIYAKIGFNAVKNTQKIIVHGIPRY